MLRARPLREIGTNELLQRGVWTYDLDEERYTDGQDESWIQPEERLPVNSLTNCVVATCVTLANGTAVPAVLGNISLNDARVTSQYLCLSVERNGAWFHLARYFDTDWKARGPSELAVFLGLPIDEVFPITYNISELAIGAERVLAGSIGIEPVERLTDAELLALSLGGMK